MMQSCSCGVRLLVVVLLLVCHSSVTVLASSATASKPIMGNDVSSSSSTAQHPTPLVDVEGIFWPVEKDLEHDPIVVEHQQPHQATTHKKNNPTKLRLNGAGVRSISIFGWDFKVYVAGFYHAAAVSPLASTDQVYEAVQEHAMQFDFTFLRTFAQGQVTEAWQRQLEHSVDHRYDDYEKDRDAFIASFGPIVNGGTVSVALHPCGRTVLVDQGARKNTIQSRNFQRAFLSMWFGPKAVQSDLKQGLLGAGNLVKHATTVERTVDMNGQ